MTLCVTLSLRNMFYNNIYTPGHTSLSPAEHNNTPPESPHCIVIRLGEG